MSRRTTLTPLAIVLPHPHLPHRRSSLLSLNSATSPHTPRSCPSPCPPPPVYYSNAHRKSTDSWNSSNADDMDFDWKPEQVLLLSRTLDALPAHLVTPFNGPIPPSNLLDKIARGVSQAKGPLDWPHSIRATRVKLIELARARAKEDTLAEQRRQVIKEEVEIEDGSSYDGERPIRAVGSGPRRPLYRQSSMDFINPGPDNLKDNPTITHLSNRLQRSDRTLPNASYHPYSRMPRSSKATAGTSEVASSNRRSSSPPHPSDVPALISPSAPSSSTLNSFSSLSSSAAVRPRVLHRSASTLSSGSLFSTSSSGMSLEDPRIQRVRRADSFCGLPPAPPPKDYPHNRQQAPVTAGLKRMPSYGAMAQEVRHEGKAALKAATREKTHTHARKLSGSYPSSDEEEKARTRRAKKIRTKTGAVPATTSGPPTSLPPSPMVCTTPSSPRPVATIPMDEDKAPPTPAKDRDTRASSAHKIAASSSTAAAARAKSPRVLAGSAQLRSAAAMASVLPPSEICTPTKLRSPAPLPPTSPLSPSPASALGSRIPLYGDASASVPPSPLTLTSPALMSPTSALRVKTLRRTRRLAPARRISFGSLLASGDEDEDSGGGSGGLASRKEPEKSGGGLVFGAVLGEGFSVKPRAVPEKRARRDEGGEKKERTRGLLKESAFKENLGRGEGAKERERGRGLGSAFQLI